MEKQQDVINYERIAAAIAFVKQHFREQPSLSTIADHVHVSPDHFQRIFQEWAGTSPKKFLQYTSLQHAKKLLLEKQVTLFDATFETGLSSTSRLHDLFINIEGMSPAEFKNGGKDLTIHYGYYPTKFGQTLIASTAKGICYVSFEEDQQQGLFVLASKFPRASLRNGTRLEHQSVLRFFSNDWNNLPQIKLHLRGTDFQLKVWEALLKIPAGNCLATKNSHQK